LVVTSCCFCRRRVH